MRNSSTWWIIAGIMVLLDFYVFQAIKTVSNSTSEKTRMIVLTGYWVISACTLITLLSFPYIQALQTSKVFRNYVFAILAGLFFSKLLGSVFFLVDDFRRIAMWITAKIFPSTGAHFADEGGGISRSIFLSWIGLGIGGGLFSTLLYGFSNKYNYQIKRVKLAFGNLPNGFKGLKIIHISDIHSGSFQNKHAVQHGVDMILKEKADLILFTGDFN